MSSSTVYVVHCIDTEGPLYESLRATFERLKHAFGLDFDPSYELLNDLQQGTIDLGGLEEEVSQYLDPDLLDYNDNWGKIESMLEDAMSEEFRNGVPDSNGNGWHYNWFCVDFVDFEYNPRRRDIGVHNIYDRYRQFIEKYDSNEDGIQFHFHPHPFKSEAHKSGNHWWANSRALYKILTRRIIERGWFPAANREHILRSEGHDFLERYIPFDFANRATDIGPEDRHDTNISLKRQLEWSRAPVSWSPYHPSHDDVQVRGNCRRWIARCLFAGTRHTGLTRDEVRRAFDEAQDGKPVVLSFADHDYRDIRPTVKSIRTMIQEVSEDYPGVDFEYSEAVEAVRQALELNDCAPCDFDLTLEKIKSGVHRLNVRTEVQTFGPHPYLALKTASGRFLHDNFYPAVEPGHEWYYVFDEETIKLDQLETIGVAANNEVGVTTVTNLDVDTRETDTTIWNE